MIINFKCQECGSSDVAELDGFFVCQGCGLTVDDPVLQYNLSSFKTDKKGKAIQTHALLLNSTQIGNYQERKFKTTQTNFTRLNKIHRSLSPNENSDAKMIFKNLIAQSGIAADIELFMDPFKKIFPKIKKHSKSRNLHLFCTTIYYVVMAQQCKNISLKTLLANQNIDHREFFICIKAIFIEIPELFKERAETMDIMIGHNISKVCDELYLSREIRRIAFKIADKFADRLGFKSRIIAASAVTIAVRIVSKGNCVSILQISECLEITASTVYSHIKNVNIDVLRKNYQDYLFNLENPIHKVIPQETIQQKIKKLDVEKITLEEVESSQSSKIQVPIPVIMVEKNINQPNKIKRKRTSEFISNNKDLFSRYIPNTMVCGSFGISITAQKYIEIPRSLNIPNNLANFAEFEFSPPIS